MFCKFDKFYYIWNYRIYTGYDVIDSKKYEYKPSSFLIESNKYETSLRFDKLDMKTIKLFNFNLSTIKDICISIL